MLRLQFEFSVSTLSRLLHHGPADTGPEHMNEKSPFRSCGLAGVASP
jgi:hypothetical protein